MVVGAYGSGKTEVSVNLAVAVAASGRKVQIADRTSLDDLMDATQYKEYLETL